MFTKNGPIVSYKIDRNRKNPSDILISLLKQNIGDWGQN